MTELFPSNILADLDFSQSAASFNHPLTIPRFLFFQNDYGTAQARNILVVRNFIICFMETVVKSRPSCIYASTISSTKDITRPLTENV